ncbi:MAG: methyl-accepting chemotaxis protein [Promethearchaeota archaeon]
MNLLEIGKDIKLSYKLISGFLIVACLSGVVGFVGILQINILDSTILEITDVNVEQADWSMELIIGLEEQLVAIHAAMLGEEDMIHFFSDAHEIMEEGFDNLNNLLKETTQESLVPSLRSKYTTFINTCNDSITGVFASMAAHKAAVGWKETQYWRIDELQDEMDDDLQKLEAMVVHYAQHNTTPFEPNVTLVDNAMELNLLLWRCGDHARMYMATPLNQSVTATLERAAIRAEYADESSILAETTYVQFGLEKEFTDLLAEAETNYAQALATGQCNATCVNILADIRENFVWKEHELGPLHDPFATSIRCQEDGVFVSYDKLVAAWVAAETAMEVADELAMDLMQDLEALELWVGQKMENAKSEADTTVNYTTYLTMIVTVITIILGVFLGLLLAISITRPLTTVVGLSKQISNGDLAVDTSIIDANRKDEIGVLSRSSKEMVDFLRPAIHQIGVSAEKIAGSSQEMASSAEEVNASTEEISSVSQQISKGTQQQTAQINEVIQQSEDLKMQFTDKLNDIKLTSNLIEDIAGQVNMLALNASIEAARAGEYGRGFAVVADNIRKLADETKTSVSKVDDIIGDLSSSMLSAIETIAESVTAIASVAEETATGAEENSAASEEQAATMQEMAASAQELAQIAEDLNKLVERFTT